MQLKGKKAIIIGERDVVQGPAIAECLESAGAEPVLCRPSAIMRHSKGLRKPNS